MENEKIIIILLGIIVIMLVFGLLMFNTSIFGKDSAIVINAMDSIDTGSQFSVQLTDSNGNPIINQEIEITFKNTNGSSSTKKAMTDSSGVAYVQLGDLSAGEYNVGCQFKGNSQYKGSSTSKLIKINTAQVTASSTQPSESSGLSEDGYSYYPEYGPAVDYLGQTREFAIANNYHYIPMTIDGVDCSVYVPYDSKAGCYHT
jgi:hypothetical protein